jgi:YHS domain-containing protein
LENKINQEWKKKQDMSHRIDQSAGPDPEPVFKTETIHFPETVCHRVLTGDTTYIPNVEFHGRLIYFCTDTCLSVFLSDPERFYNAHSRRRKP